jgi:hypothetical protein
MRVESDGCRPAKHEAGHQRRHDGQTSTAAPEA